MDSRIPILVPPDGLFNANALQWAWDYTGRTPVEIARIPEDRLDDFVDGEGRRTMEFETSFWIRRSNSNPGPKSAWVKTITYWCAYGPQNIPSRLPAAPPMKGTFPPFGKGENSRPRARKKDFNDHLKRGCMCNFVVIIYKSAPKVAVIYYRQRLVYVVQTSLATLHLYHRFILFFVCLYCVYAYLFFYLDYILCICILQTTF